MNTPIQFWTLTPPRQWQAGTTGADRTPFYFDCADCGAKEPPIAAIASTDGTFKGIALKQLPNGFFNPAMFCAPCAAARRIPALATPPELEPEPRCVCPDGGQPIIPHGSGDADCARCRLPWFGSDDDDEPAEPLEESAHVRAAQADCSDDDRYIGPGD